MKFISDQEIDLNQVDFLKTKVYSDNLHDVILSTQIDRVFTIGLYGSWGSGKSSIIETTKQRFDEKKDKVKFITYDAWQYSNDSFRRMFLRCLSKELKYKETVFMKRFYENESREVDNEFKLSYTKSIYVLFALLGLLVLFSFFNLELDNKVTIFSIVTILGTLTALFSGVFHQLKVTVTKPYVFAPEQFEDCFKEIASKALKPNSFFDRVKYLNNTDCTVKDLNRLVIVIDNIDRCNSETAYQLLTDIKTFLGRQKFSIVFIIPVDDKALLKNFFSKSKIGFEHQDKEEFLRKIFNITLRIKPYNSTDIFAFTKAVCDHNQINLKNETINLMGNEYSSNPRRIIQLINNLIVELNSYDEKFATSYETLICCILIIRENYNDFYETVYKNASLLINYNIFKQEKEIQEYDRFMRIAVTEFQQSTNGILNTILMNSDNHFKELSVDLIEIVDTFDTIKLREYLITNDHIEDDFYNYLRHKVDEAHDNNLNTNLSKYMQMCSIVNSEKNIPKPYLIPVFEKFRSKVETIFYHSDDLDSLMHFIQFQNEFYRQYDIKMSLLNLIAGRIHTTEVTVQNRWYSIFNSVIENLTDEETSEKIKDDYLRQYSSLISVNDIQEEQFAILVTDKFISNRIQEIISTDMEHIAYEEAKVLVDRLDKKEFVINEIFKKFNSQDFFKNELESIFIYVALFNDFITHLKKYVSNYDGEYLELNMQNIFYIRTSETKYEISSGQKIFDIFSDDNSKTESLLTLIINYYDFIRNEKVIRKYLKDIYAYQPLKVREFLVQLLNDNQSVSDYYSLVSDSLDFEDENLLTLIECYLTNQEDDFHIINVRNSNKVLKNLIAVFENVKLRIRLNKTFISVLNKENTTELVFNVFNEEIMSSNYKFISFLEEDLKKKYAKFIVLNSYKFILTPEIAKFCFEVDDEILNEQLLQLIDKAAFQPPSFNILIKYLIELITSNKDKKLSKLLEAKLTEKFASSNFNKGNSLVREMQIKIKALNELF